MTDIPNISNINQYNQHFNNEAQHIKNQPKVDRNCNDKCCYGVFIFFSLLLIVGGIYFLSKANFGNLTPIQYFNTTSNTASTASQPYQVQNIKPGLPIILGMIVFSVVLATILLCLLVKFPKCIFYTMLIVGAVLIAALAIMFLSMGQIALGIIVLVVLLLCALFLFCYKDKIKTGIILLQTASNFVIEKPSVFLAPFIFALIAFGFEIFWVLSLIGITLYPTTGSTQDQINSYQNVSTIFTIIWIFLQFFYTFFFNYCVVFIIATAAAFWYYKVEDNFLCVGLKRIVANHLGSLTFAAIIVAIIELARRGTQRRANQSQGPAAICLSILACCFGMIEDLVQTLNHNAIIVMAVTGQSYIDSAKSTLSLIFDNFTLFILIEIMTTLLKLVGIMFICVIPGIVGFLMLKATAQNPDDSYFIGLSTATIVIISMLIAIIFLSILSQALSCVFIFYCLDCKLMKLGYPAPQNCPQVMRKLFQQLNKSGVDSYSAPPQNQGQNNYGYGNYQQQPSYGNQYNNSNNYNSGYNQNYY